jgi:hypothetical protein
MSYEYCRDEILQARELMGSLKFWCDEQQVQNVAKALWAVYLAAPKELKQIALGTLNEFLIRMSYCIGFSHPVQIDDLK